MPYFHFLLSSVFWNERAWYEGKEERCESCWGICVENERVVGLRESQCIHMADSLRSPHPFCPRRVLSIHILIAVPPFGELSVRERVTSFPLSFLFSWQEAIEELFLSALIVLFTLHGFSCQSDHTVSSLLIIPRRSLLVHWRQVLHKGGVTSVCRHCVPSSPCVSTLCSLLSSDL